ncbi:MAG: ATPase domain-containing protein [Halobacteriota archaeon]|nr:ATPase domain-containing protein [Halobacteriota archaeon]
MTGTIERIPSGIRGLDEMIEGGFPFPSTILVAGGTGTGKTTLSMQILFESVKKGDKCIYFSTFSESSKWTLKFLSGFDFINEELTNEIEFVELGVYIRAARSVEEILDVVEKKIEMTKPKKIIIDPISIVGDILKKDHYRTFLYDLTTLTKNQDVLTILTGEMLPDSTYPPTLAFISDGVILLYYDVEGEKRRHRIEILKMRGTNHYTGRYPFEIDKSGLTIYPTK